MPRKHKIKKKTEKRETSESIRSIIQQDMTSEMLKQVYMRTIVLNVNHLNTTWKIEQQQEIDSKHIEKLQESFQVRIRPYKITIRMKAACSHETFEKILI